MLDDDLAQLENEPSEMAKRVQEALKTFTAEELEQLIKEIEARLSNRK